MRQAEPSGLENKVSFAGLSVACCERTNFPGRKKKIILLGPKGKGGVSASFS